MRSTLTAFVLLLPASARADDAQEEAVRPVERLNGHVSRDKSGTVTRVRLWGG
jgi:hypothetical protein